MQKVTDHVRWCASDDERPFLAWVSDRSTVGAGSAGRHLVPIAAVGRLPDGRLAVDALRPAGTPLSSALDTLGTPTTGVAVTLTVPLLELAATERCGAVRIGAAGLDDVLVDDAGAVVLCDRPPGSDGVRRSDQDGARVLVLAARVVWERTDDRDPARPVVDAALAEALDGDVDAVRAALARVRATAAPRPVRWDPPTDDLLVGVPDAAATSDGSLLAVLRETVERGIPLGGDRRLPLRRALVGVVVAAGATAAAVFALG
ncbi:hypothetical protein FHW23_001431 [Curtobacterium pusillum]|uniref:Uncharacterized protein n=1 Tax=Curtobacterium pusillum TaxID=69373 RepID=A0AAW3T5J6_9MICO|nr:hypothetical protein [Curtobacterium pusillum]MBA8990185.1 hypothetical protein [Curtobacterium pusillum]